MTVDIIIPVFNIQKRGFNRVYFSIYSLMGQNYNKIYIVDGSEERQYNALNGLIKDLPKVEHVPMQLDVFNKPKLLNRGIKMSKADYIFCTDCDYIFSKDLLEICENQRSDKVMLHKEVLMLPNLNMTCQRIQKWLFPKSKLNQWGKLANGALQYATRSFFVNNPYPETMEGFGAMDNIMAYMAKANGLKLLWITEGQILHIHHRVQKFIKSWDHQRFSRNQKILNAYISKHKLAKML